MGMMEKWYSMMASSKELPSWFTRISYIASQKVGNVGAYINTGSPVLKGDKITLIFRTETDTGEQYIYGWRWSGNYANPYQLNVGINVGYRSITAGKASNAEATGTRDAFQFGQDNTLVIDTENNTITVNGQTPTGLQFDLSVGTAFNSEGSSAYNPYLLSFNRIGSAPGPAQTTKIYEYIVERDGVEIKHFVPIVNLNGRYGMYDLVGRKAYYSAVSTELLGA